MTKVLDIAQYMCDEYKKETNEELDELKLHKLLYFAQRESLAINGKPLFDEKFEGWIHGPVSIEVRSYYDKWNGINKETKDISNEEKRIVNNVLYEYGQIASWKLRDLSHQEISWQNSRIGLRENEKGNRHLSIADIKEDSKKVRPFDYTWGMYYDEFDDYLPEGE